MMASYQLNIALEAALPRKAGTWLRHSALVFGIKAINSSGLVDRLAAMWG